MLALKRQEIILQRLEIYGQITVMQLSQEFNVSSETIRRDIHLLSSKNLLRKVHGGAVSIRGNRIEPDYENRKEQNIEEKDVIAKYAVQFIHDNDVIGLDTGATIDWLCRHLPDVKNLTIVVSSISALEILMQRVKAGEISPKIIFLGGEVNYENVYTQGPLVTEILSRFSLDKCFVAATAISSAGIKSFDLFDGEFSKAMIRQSDIVYYLGASEKNGQEALYKICDLQEVNHLITDNRFPLEETLLKQLNRNKVQCHIVPLEGRQNHDE